LTYFHLKQLWVYYKYFNAGRERRFHFKRSAIALLNLGTLADTILAN